MKNNTNSDVTCYFRFNDVKVKELVKGGGNDFYRTTQTGLKLASICAGQVGKDNVVEYTETLQPNGEVIASGLVRNPMGF